MYLMKILMQETDENHAITLQEIVDHLKAYGVTAERKSLYSDIENLRIFGLDKAIDVAKKAGAGVVAAGSLVLSVVGVVVKKK